MDLHNMVRQGIYKVIMCGHCSDAVSQKYHLQVIGESEFDDNVRYI